MMKLLCLAMLAAMLLVTGAMAEMARVVTPGGKVNVRKTADEKGRIQMTVANRAMVEVLEEGEEWCLIRAQKKEGYIKTEYLRLPSAMVGRAVYPDAETLLVRRDPEEDAEIVSVSNVSQAVTVLALEDDWARVRTADGAEGYVSVQLLSYQYDAQAADIKWITLQGIVWDACTLYTAADTSSEEKAQLHAGQELTVTVHDKAWSLVCADGQWGYLPTGAIRLQGIGEDNGMPTGDDRETARSLGAAALKKAVRSFAKTKTTFDASLLDGTDGISGPLAWCVWLTAEDQVRYGALVRLSDGKVLYKEDFADFSAEQIRKEPLPVGTLNLTLSADTLDIGAVLDVSMETWSTYQMEISLTKDGKVCASCSTKGHTTTAFRPREAGQYTLTVSVTDEEKNTASASADFTVTTETAAEAADVVYSQKDGWWADKAYRKRNLESSGCAIFTLAHALQRMNITGPETTPEKLAATFALCLTENGTNNGRLIREGAEAFGYSVKGDLFDNKAKIVSWLQEGCMFSFSVARGHIALIDGVSEDGTMVHVVDSAPTATFTRIVNTSMYIQNRGGDFVPVTDLEDIPGARWYFETDSCGGLTYWMETSYAAKRGVRLIIPAETAEEK